jgi:hypothetical protein
MQVMESLLRQRAGGSVREAQPVCHSASDGVGGKPRSSECHVPRHSAQGRVATNIADSSQERQHCVPEDDGGAMLSDAVATQIWRCELIDQSRPTG